MAKFIRIAGESLLPAESKPAPNVPTEWAFDDLMISRAPGVHAKAWRVDSQSTTLPDGFMRWAREHAFSVTEARTPSPKAARTVVLEPSRGGGQLTSENPRSRRSRGKLVRGI